VNQLCQLIEERTYTEVRHNVEDSEPGMALQVLSLEDPMRSELIFGALVHVPNRYQLALVLSKITRELHRPGARIQDTMNDALVRFTSANPIADVEGSREAAGIPVRRKRAHSSWDFIPLTELKRKTGGQTSQVA
jgi:hypothetical protein